MTSSEAGCRGQGGLRLLSRESPIIFRTPSLPRSAQEPPPRSPLSVHKSIEHKIVLYIPPVSIKKSTVVTCAGPASVTPDAVFESPGCRR